MPKNKKPPPTGYEVGYGRPPKEGQFKKGRSGNPTGRPKGTPNIAKMAQKALFKKVSITIDGVSQEVLMLEAAFLQLSARAAKGDPTALRNVLQFAALLGLVDAEAAPDTAPPATEADLLISLQARFERSNAQRKEGDTK